MHFVKLKLKGNTSKSLKKILVIVLFTITNIMFLKDEFEKNNGILSILRNHEVLTLWLAPVIF